MPSALHDRLASVADTSTLRLTHYGRKTGRRYEVTIWFLVDKDRIYLTTMNRHRQWVRNAMKTPHIRLRIGGEEFEGTIGSLTGDKEMRHVYELLTRKYWAMWLLDWAAWLVGRDPRRGKMDLGRGGFFQVQLDR